jgi:diaminopimelate decarboxylase
LCMNIDVLGNNIRLPALQRGDLVLIKHTGAYNFTQSMQFIYRRPNYLLISDGKVHCIRAGEQTNYVREPETLPPHLQTAETKNSFLITRKSRQE